jgi:hypothetical protein
VTAKLDAPSRWRGTLAVAMLVVGIPLVALGVVPSLAGAVALAVVLGGGMIVGEVLGETALPRMLDDEVLARAYGLVFPISISGIVAGSLIAGPLVSVLGLTGALGVAGLAVLSIGALLVSRPLDVTATATASVPAVG